MLAEGDSVIRRIEREVTSDVPARPNIRTCGTC